MGRIRWSRVYRVKRVATTSSRLFLFEIWAWENELSRIISFLRTARQAPRRLWMQIHWVEVSVCWSPGGLSLCLLVFSLSHNADVISTGSRISFGYVLELFSACPWLPSRPPASLVIVETEGEKMFWGYNPTDLRVVSFFFFCKCNFALFRPCCINL